MQIRYAEVTLVELPLAHPVRLARLEPIAGVAALFVRLETVHGHNAWGAAIAHPDLTGETAAHALHACQECAYAAPGLHPTNLEFSLAEIEKLAKNSPAARCAFDLAFHDLLGLAAGMPLYRLLGGYRNEMPTAITIPLTDVENSVKIARQLAGEGFRKLKVKGGMDPELDVRRVRAIARALPNHMLWLDADGGYSVSQALEVARTLQGKIEMLEQPTPPKDLDALGQVSRNSPTPVFADQSAQAPETALELAARRLVHGMSVKLATSGGLRPARQIDAIARAARLGTMVSCLIEPALLIAAGLHYALSSPIVQYADLDGHLHLATDPTLAGFRLQDGCLLVSEVPGLGCTVDLA